MGVPVGPDTSNLLADIVLSAVDQSLPQSLRGNSYRYVDDYEFGFKTRSEAEEALGAFQYALRGFELDLNPRKSSVLELPAPTDALWVSRLRTFDLRSGWRQRSDLIHYWDTAVEAYRSGESKYVLRYAIQRMSKEVVSRKYWDMYHQMLLQAILVEPGTLRFALFEMVKYQSAGYDLDLHALEENLNEIIRHGLIRGHDTTVGWALWCCIVLNIRVRSSVLGKLADSRDNIIALLSLDAVHKGLADGELETENWSGLMTNADLSSEIWLLAYEANIKGWLPSVTGEDHVGLDESFRFLRTRGVSFYHLDAVAEYKEAVRGGTTQSRLWKYGL